MQAQRDPIQCLPLPRRLTPHRRPKRPLLSGIRSCRLQDVDGTLTGLGAGSSVMARAEGLSAVRSNGHPTPYRIPAKLLYDPWPSDRRRRVQEEAGQAGPSDEQPWTPSSDDETGDDGPELAGQNSSRWRGAEGARRRAQELQADSYVKPCDPTMAMYDPACRARKRAPYEVAYQGYGIFRGEYSAAATVTQATKLGNPVARLS